MFEGSKRVNVMQGMYETSAESPVIFSAVLGSCIAVCVHDPIVGVGGMNHILLPGKAVEENNTDMNMYGINLMELLLNDLYKKGALKSRLELKVFGGAKVLDSSIDAGTLNIAFIESFIEAEGLKVISSSTGGRLGRRLEFHPVSGRSRQKVLSDANVVQTEIPKPVKRPDDGDLELF